MSNLLRLESVKALQKSNLVRSAAVLLFVLAALGVVSTLALLPAYLQTSAQVSSLEKELAPLEVDAEAQRAESRELTLVQERLDALAVVVEQEATPTEAMRLVLDKKPEGVIVDEVGYFKNDIEDIGTIRVAGEMETRGQLQTYVAALEGVALFDQVSVPVSALADADEGKFVITASGAF